MSEESSSKKEEEFFGMPISKLGLPAIGVGLGAAAIALYSLFKPQIDQRMGEMSQRQAYVQQQQMLAAQEQQRQLAMQQQYQQPPIPQEQPEMQAPPEQPPSPEVDPRFAIEQDPFARNSQRRVRIPEIDASEQAGQGRFNNISV